MPPSTSGIPEQVPTPAVEASSEWAIRLGNAIPIVISLLLASVVFWMPFNATTANWLAIGLTIFFTYWVLRSYSVAVAVWIGLRRIRTWERTHWESRFEIGRAHV